MSYIIKKQLVEVATLMYKKGFVSAFEGNLSIKHDDRIYITPSAVCKGFLTEEMIAVTDLDGNIPRGGFQESKYKPSSEIKLHLCAYRSRPDISSVAHTHSPYATAFAIANKPIETRGYTEMIALYGKIPLARYGTPSTDEIFYGVQEYIGSHDIILLANHGVMSVGKDAYDAFFKIESVECIAKTLAIVSQLGGEKEIPRDKLEELYAMHRRNNR